MLSIPASRSSVVDSANESAGLSILLVSSMSDSTLIQLCGSVLREMRRREFERLDNASLTDLQAIIDNWD